MTTSTSVEGTIRRWVDRLERVSDRISHCAVIVEQPHRHHRQGNLFHVHVELGLPGRASIAANASDERASTAISAAFRATRRQLEDRVRTQRDRRVA